MDPLGTVCFLAGIACLAYADDLFLGKGGRNNQLAAQLGGRLLIGFGVIRLVTVFVITHPEVLPKPLAGFFFR